MKRLRRVMRGGQIYADDLNELFEAVEGLLNTVGDGIDVEDADGAKILRVPPTAVRLHARVWADSGAEDEDGGACGKQAYQWQQRIPTSCGGWEDDTDYGL